MDKNEAIAKLDELVNQVNICMLTTLQENGELHARPMVRLGDEFEGKFWFFTKSDSPKVYEIKNDSQVNLAFSEPKYNTYVSCKGIAKIINDKIKARELWSSMCEIWFPKGVSDPSLVLIEVTVNEAEYWDSPSSTFKNIIGFVKASLTDNKTYLGDNEKITL